MHFLQTIENLDFLSLNYFHSGFCCKKRKLKLYYKRISNFLTLISWVLRKLSNIFSNVDLSLSKIPDLLYTSDKNSRF